MPPTATERDELRAGIESTNNVARQGIEEQYISDKNALEAQYQQDIKDNAKAKRDAFVAAGLNPDGSDPQGRPQG